MVRIETQHQWVAKLEALAPEIKALPLRRKNDCRYVEVVAGKPVHNDADAFNFANSSLHDQMLIRAVADLSKRVSPTFVNNLLGSLTYRNTYGAFSEIATYDWLAQTGIDFTAQVEMDNQHVVNPNGSTLDGCLSLGTKKVYFDVKGFGFIDHKLALLKKRLQERFPANDVTIEGTVSVSIDLIQEHLEHPGFESLVDELGARHAAARSSLRFTLRQKRRVSVSTREVNMERLAHENREYVLGFSRQFARLDPFMLFFVIHPWFSQSVLHQNFDGSVDRFCKLFSELSFHSFREDTMQLEGLEKRELSKLLAGVGFINAWPEPSSKGKGPSNRIYLNSAAHHSLDPNDFAAAQTKLGRDLDISVV